MSRVLIADDEPNILISLEFLMKREGHQVFVARDGDAGGDAGMTAEPTRRAERRAAPKPARVPLGDRPAYSPDEGLQ